MPSKPHPGASLSWTGRALDGLKRGTASRFERFEIVLVVHGTYANPARDCRDVPQGARQPEYPKRPLWWEAGGSFRKSLEAALERHGSPARCGLPLGLWEGHNSWSGWSGLNSEVERRRGAYDLAKHIRALQSDPAVRRIHLVAHSHGGNVVRRALRYLNHPRHKLGKVVCLGTPFLHFADKKAWRRWLSRIHWPMLIVFLGSASASEYLRSPLDGSSAPNAPAGYMLLFVAGAALYSFWRYWRTSEASSDDVEATAVRFHGDEAIRLMEVCAELTAQPHVHLRDLWGPAGERRTKPPGRAPGRSADSYDRLEHRVASAWRLTGNGFARVSNLWNGPVRRGAERVTSLAYRVPLLGGVCALGLILAFRPYRPPLRPFLSSRLPRLASLFFHSMREEMVLSTQDVAEDRVPPSADPAPDWFEPLRSPRPWWDDPLKHSLLHPDSARMLAALAAAALYVPLYPLDKLLGVPAWLSAVMTRFAILAGVRAGAASAPGVDMLGAAFRPARTGQIPKKVTDVVVPEAIEQQVLARLRPTNSLDLLRPALDPARHTSLLQDVKCAFTDITLLHAQYYQDERLIDFVAQVIAGKQPLWMGETDVSDGLAATIPPS